jgi:hypothetical protein
MQIHLWLQEGCVGEPDLTIDGNVARTDLNSPDLGVGAGKIRSMKIVRTMDWTGFKLACCRGDSSVSSAECQQYWGPGSNSTGDCDQLMQTWCAANPWEPNCGCLVSKTKDIAPCVDPQCINNNAYQNTNQRQILKGGCPDKIVCTQKVVLGNNATDNVIKTQMYQICGNVDPGAPSGPTTVIDRTPSTTPTPVRDDTMMWILILVLILMVFSGPEKGSGTSPETSWWDRITQM